MQSLRPDSQHSLRRLVDKVSINGTAQNVVRSQNFYSSAIFANGDRVFICCFFYLGYLKILRKFSYLKITNIS